MLSSVSERKNVLLLLVLLSKIRKPIKSLDAVIKLVYNASKNGVPFEYNFSKIGDDIMECPKLIDDLDFLSECRLISKEFIKEQDNVYVVFSAKIEESQLEQVSRRLFDEKTLVTIENFVSSVKNKIPQSED